jgi:hypothetical protein
MRPRFTLAIFAEIDDVLIGVAASINTMLAPYQPNLPGYPNVDPRAGTIVATMVAPGQPIILPVTTRLENGQAQVAVYPTEPGRVEGEIRTDDPTISTSTTVTYEVARQSLRVIVEVWASTRPKILAIASLIRQFLGDIFTLSMADGTVTKFLYHGYHDDETEQAHSVYIRQLKFEADYTTTTTFPGAPVTTQTITPSIVASITPYSPLATQL